MAEFIWDDAFFQEYFPKLVKIAANYVYDVALAEDMAQEAFVILLDKWKAGKISSADNIGAWLKVVVINRCRSEMQKMRYHVEQPLKDDVIDPRIPDALPFADKLPKGLSEAERQVLCCFYEYRMTLKEIASYCGITEDASRMRLHRARMHCKKLLQRGEKNV